MIPFQPFMNAKELEQYKQEIISEHESEIAAIDRLIARERNKPSASANGWREVPITARKRGRPRRKSAASIVREAVSQAGRRFSRKGIAAYAEAEGTPLTSRTVSVELWKMAKAGEIRTIKEGRGRIPAQYEKMSG